MAFDAIRPDLRPTSGPYLVSPINLGSGNTASRPVLTSSDRGYYKDTTIGKVIFWSGTRWHTQDGTSAANF